MEYLADGEVDSEYEKEAKPYQREIDFAFFAVNFGYSKEEYEQLTFKEIAFIKKEWENKIIRDSYNMYKSVFTAFYNVNRPKNKGALKLWKTKPKKVDKAEYEENIKIIKHMENKNGKSWVDKIYKANGLKRKKGG